MHDWLKKTAAAVPERAALICGDRTLTYAQLDDEVDRAASWLASLGVGPGIRVGLYARSSVEAVAIIHALPRLGAICVPLNTRLNRVELQSQMHVVELLLYDDDPGVRIRRSEQFADYTKFHGPPAPFVPFESNRTHTLIFTSGTSGAPKAAQLTIANHYASAAASALRIGVLPNDRWLCCLPIFHVGGLAILLRSAIYGTCVVLHDGFDVERVNCSLDTDVVTVASFVPTMLFRLIESRTTRPPHLTLCLIGGAAATPALVQRAQAAGFPVATTYGMTETGSQITTQTVEQTLQKPGCVGKAIPPYTQVWIERDDGMRAATGEIGEIVVRGLPVMRAYYGNPDATLHALRRGGLHTGDMGYLDEDGDLWIVQRRSDLIISGGENVYPAEIEAALRAHPAVRDVCVVGVPHEEWGQQVAALIVADVPVSEAEITDFLRGRIAGYKLPRLLRFAAELPMTGSGKVERKSVAALLSDA